MLKNYLITSLTSCENLKLIKARVFNPDLALLFIPLCGRSLRPFEHDPGHLQPLRHHPRHKWRPRRGQRRRRPLWTLLFPWWVRADERHFTPQEVHYLDLHMLLECQTNESLSSILCSSRMSFGEMWLAAFAFGFEMPAKFSKSTRIL